MGFARAQPILRATGFDMSGISCSLAFRRRVIAAPRDIQIQFRSFACEIFMEFRTHLTDYTHPVVLGLVKSFYCIGFVGLIGGGIVNYFLRRFFPPSIKNTDNGQFGKAASKYPEDNYQHITHQRNPGRKKEKNGLMAGREFRSADVSNQTRRAQRVHHLLRAFSFRWRRGSHSAPLS